MEPDVHDVSSLIHELQLFFLDHLRMFTLSSSSCYLQPSVSIFNKWTSNSCYRVPGPSSYQIIQLITKQFVCQRQRYLFVFCNVFSQIWISNGGIADVFTVFARTEVTNDKVSSNFHPFVFLLFIVSIVSGWIILNIKDQNCLQSNAGKGNRIFKMSPVVREW